MSQAPVVIADGSGAAVLAAINAAFQALVTQASGASAPTTTYPFMLWADTANNLLKMRNAANTAWLVVGELNGPSITGGRLLARRLITATSVNTSTAGTNFCDVYVVGGGGGGGAANAAGAAQAAAGSGGGGGGFARKRITSGFNGVTVTIGAGGVAAVGSGGGVGGTTSFGGILSATGGGGGAIGGVQSNANSFFYGAIAAGGLGSGGDINMAGGWGKFGFIAPTSLQVSGEGGSSFFGPGGYPIVGLGGGANGTNYGSGGSGGSVSPSTGPASGGFGAPGLCVVEDYS